MIYQNIGSHLQREDMDTSGEKPESVICSFILFVKNARGRVNLRCLRPMLTTLCHIRGIPICSGTQTTGKAFAILATLARLRQRTVASEGRALTVGYPLPSRFLTPPNVDRAVPSHENYSHISFCGKMRKFLQVHQNGQKWNKRATFLSLLIISED